MPTAKYLENLNISIFSQDYLSTHRNYSLEVRSQNHTILNLKQLLNVSRVINVRRYSTILVKRLQVLLHLIYKKTIDQKILYR